MKLITLSYYSDFSRFFSSMTRTEGEIEIINYCVNLSAYLHKSPKTVKSVFLPFATRANSPIEYPSKEEIRWIIEYPTKLGGKIKNLEKIASLYYTYFKKSIKENTPNIIIISGDTRLQSRALKLAAEHLKITILYFEQGPNNTTILDLAGVNATASFAQNKTK